MEPAMNKELLELVADQFEKNPYTKEKFLTHSETNMNLVDELAAEEGLVIDVGCGINPFKPYVKNLIGLDVAHYPEADLTMSIEEASKKVFTNGCASVIIALGSINFGEFSNIKNQIGIMIDLVKPGGKLIMRGRQGGIGQQRIIRNERAFRHHCWTREEVYEVHNEFKDKVKWIHEPIEETAAAGADGKPGTPHPTKEMKLFVWRWERV